MTYLTFLLVFLALPIVGLIIAQPKPMAGIGAVQAWKWIALVCGIALVYTTPWDNYLVYRGVWDYGSERVLGTIGYVPIEEYIFFILQPIMTGLWVCLLLGKQIDRDNLEYNAEHWRARLLLTGLWLILTVVGILLLFGERSLYMGLILAWACPVLAGMSWISTPDFWRYRRVWVLGILVPTLYLWIADRIAIGDGIWDISDTYSFNWDPLGLPIEEAVFFLVTNTLVVQGLLMFLPLARREGV